MKADNNDSHCPNGENNCPIYNDLAELRSKVDTLSTQVRSDFLTNLYNKQHLLFSLEQEMERTSRSLQATSLIMLDVDHFKKVNDTHGHIAGDKVLQQLACIIKDTVRKIDIPCRYGGEEFAIILPSSPSLIGVQVAERLRKKVETTPFVISDSLQLSVTISLGVHAYLHTNSFSVEEFLERTDKQLYRAKENGRNRVCHFIPDKKDQTVVSNEERDALFDALNPKK